jgi:hypothetical protein
LVPNQQRRVLIQQGRHSRIGTHECTTASGGTKMWPRTLGSFFLAYLRRQMIHPAMPVHAQEDGTGCRKRHKRDTWFARPDSVINKRRRPSSTSSRPRDWKNHLCGSIFRRH